MTEPSAIATGPSGNRSPVAITRTSAIASSRLLVSAILSPGSSERQAGPEPGRKASTVQSRPHYIARPYRRRTVGALPIEGFAMAIEHEVAIKPDIPFAEHDG